jgi:beta-galactosidase
MMRFFIITALFLWPSWGLTAQTINPQNGYLPAEGRAPWRTEFISYDIRHEVDTEMTEGSKYFRGLRFGLVRPGVYEASLDIPGLWLDRNVYIRDTGRTGRYRLTVNGQLAGYNSDTFGGGEYLVTPLLSEGTNLIALEMLAPATAGGDMERFEPDAGREIVENMYLFSQPRIHIFDYTASGHHDDEFKDDIVDLAIVIANGFNMPERVRVGYDIWGADGVRRDAVFREFTISGRGCDTVRLRGKLTGTEKFQYSADNPALYRVVLSLRHAGRDIEYIPLWLGFGVTTYDGTTVSRGGRSIEVRATDGDFPVRDGTLEKLRALRNKGFNTVAVTRPQQKWFYDMAAAEGLWVIDRAAIDCDPRGGDRTPDGTVANDPAHLPHFLDRQASMFYRRRNYPNVIGWSTGLPSGNGYNMYKSYQLLKSLDASRPVVYSGAEGEFNTDEY